MSRLLAAWFVVVGLATVSGATSLTVRARDRAPASLPGVPVMAPILEFQLPTRLPETMQADRRSKPELDSSKLPTNRDQAAERLGLRGPSAFGQSF